MKFIIYETGQVIDPRGRKFYYPPWDKWIEDKNLIRYDRQKLADRFGIYELKETTFDRAFYKEIGHTDILDGIVVTRTFEFVPRQPIGQWFQQRLRSYKTEGIKLYAKALRVEPILQLTGDTMDLVVYKQSIRDAFVAARGELQSILNGTGTDYDKYMELLQHSVVWPDPPVDEETWEEYNGSA